MTSASTKPFQIFLVRKSVTAMQTMLAANTAIAANAAKKDTDID
jgi:hypothetical protein